MVSEGDRVEFTATDDPDAPVDPGARGTVVRVDALPTTVPGETPERQVWVDWDSGDRFALLEDEDDYRVLDAE